MRVSSNTEKKFNMSDSFRVVSFTDRNTGEQLDKLPWRADIQYVDASTFGMVRFHSRRPRIPPPPAPAAANPLLTLNDDDVVGRFPALQSALSVVENQMHAKRIRVNNVDSVRQQYAAVYDDVEDTDPVHWAVWTWTKRQLLARLTRPLQLTMDDLFPRRTKVDLGPNASGDTQWYSAVLLDTPNAEPVVRMGDPHPWHVVHNARDRPATLHNNASEVAGQPDPLRDFGIKIQQWPGVGPVGHVYACCHQPMGSPGCLIGYPEPSNSAILNSKNTLYQWFGGQRVSVENVGYRGLAFKERSRFDALHEKIVARLTETLIQELQNRGITEQTPNDIIAVLMEVAELMYQYNQPLCGAGYMRPYPMERSAFIAYMQTVLRFDDDDPIVTVVAVTEDANAQLWRVVTTGTEEEQARLKQKYSVFFIDALVAYALSNQAILREYVLTLPLSRGQWDKWSKEITVLVGAMKQVPMMWFLNYPDSKVFLNTLASTVEKEIVKRAALVTTKLDRPEQIQLSKQNQTISSWLAFFFVKVDDVKLDENSGKEYKDYVAQVGRLGRTIELLGKTQQTKVKQDRALKFFLDYVPRERFYVPFVDNERLNESRRKIYDFVRVDLRADLQDLRKYIANDDYDNIKVIWDNIYNIDLYGLEWSEKNDFKQLIAEKWDIPSERPVQYLLFRDKLYKIIEYLECVADRERFTGATVCSTISQLRKFLNGGRGGGVTTSTIVSDAPRRIEKLKQIITNGVNNVGTLSKDSQAWLDDWNTYVNDTLKESQKLQYYDKVAAYTRYDKGSALVWEDQFAVDPFSWEEYYQDKDVISFLIADDPPVILYKKKWFVDVATAHADAMQQAFEFAKAGRDTENILTTLKQDTNTIISNTKGTTVSI